jgi:hypothetical protein
MIDAAPATRRDLTGWYYAAAVFWFEACGLLLVSAIVVMSPFACWGDRIDPMRFESPHRISLGAILDAGLAPHTGASGAWC